MFACPQNLCDTGPAHAGPASNLGLTVRAAIHQGSDIVLACIRQLRPQFL